MLKRLTCKLFALAVLCAALTSVASAPASSTRRILICFEMPITADCETGIVCCDSVSGTCQCGG